MWRKENVVPKKQILQERCLVTCLHEKEGRTEELLPPLTEEILSDSQAIIFCNSYKGTARTCSLRLSPPTLRSRDMVPINSFTPKLDVSLTPKSLKWLTFSNNCFSYSLSSLNLQLCPDAEVPKYHKKDNFLGISSRQETLTLSWESLFLWGFMLSYADSRALLSLDNVWGRYKIKPLEICPSLILELSNLNEKTGIQKQFRNKPFSH